MTTERQGLQSDIDALMDELVDCGVGRGRSKLVERLKQLHLRVELANLKESDNRKGRDPWLLLGSRHPDSRSNGNPATYFNVRTGAKFILAAWDDDGEPHWSFTTGHEHSYFNTKKDPADLIPLLAGVIVDARLDSDRLDEEKVR